ncbi:MAG: PilZ domain-containing protein [Deltaproteobacteria bacterium]|jgi:hypothetical protein|nr:PilZ domain-containing protein [Deltaproteobacteria bacterium]
MEQRRYDRYAAQEGAIVALRPQSYIVGQMIDIGMGGLSFGYIEVAKSPECPSELIILVTNLSFCLDRISFKTVSDIKLENDISFSSIQMRRRSVEFVNLSYRQAALIQEFILDHTAIAAQQSRKTAKFNNKPIPAFLPPY